MMETQVNADGLEEDSESNILIVEDEPAIANLIKLSLMGMGHQCTLAFDGSTALDMATSTSYDLILLDVMIPKIDGFELMPYLRPLGIPIIFLTAVTSVEKRVQGLRMGAEDYIVKPFEILCCANTILFS